MKELTGDLIYLRALEPDDLDFLYRIENDASIWEISGTLQPYSRHILKKYLEASGRDIYEAKQLRLGVCTQQKELVGLVDLYNFDPSNARAGVGIIIAEERSRNKGYGGEAIELICKYGFGQLGLHQIYAGVAASNERSLHLFKKLGFLESGRKKDWLRRSGGFEDELFLQKIKQDVH